MLGALLLATTVALSVVRHAGAGPSYDDRATLVANDAHELAPYVVAPPVRLTARPSGAASRPPRPPASTGAAAAGPPVRLVVPRLGVDAPVVPIAAHDGVLLPPSDPRTLGWWSAGARPGARRGSALVTGHTVHTGGGAFDHLDTLQAGDRVRVRTTEGVLRYVVSGVTVYRKASLARDAGRVFSQSGPGRLVLVTCDDWTGTEYLSNAVVFAEPLRG